MRVIKSLVTLDGHKIPKELIGAKTKTRAKIGIAVDRHRLLSSFDLGAKSASTFETNKNIKIFHSFVLCRFK